jgi:hypothetical protein
MKQSYAFITIWTVRKIKINVISTNFYSQLTKVAFFQKSAPATPHKIVTQSMLQFSFRKLSLNTKDEETPRRAVGYTAKIKAH